MTQLLEYLLQVLPGIVLIGLTYWLARTRDPMLRIFLLILGFILLRDALTPAGFWTFGLAGAAPWLRFSADPVVLVALGSATLLLTAGLLKASADLRRLVRWGQPTVGSVLAGLGGGVLTVLPFVLLALGAPLEDRGGPVAPALLPVLLFFALAGNLGEEVLFRGFFQGRLEEEVSPWRAALASGVLFAACHAFLATTVTGVGWPLLLFTLIEGLMCAALRMRFGVISAALAHGTAIFLLAAGLL